MQLAFRETLDAISGFGGKPVLAVAVSGGADSLALTLLAAEWAALKKGRIVALTVDHGLRPESGTEAAQLAKMLKRRGIEHHVLMRDEPIPKSNIQAWAREMRYRLMLDFCRAHKIKHLLLGHQREDNIETFFLHLERGSGLKGLSGMRAVTARGGIRLIRPLLEVPRAALEAYLKKKRVKWADDPSNASEKYRRSALRAQLAPFFAGTPNLPERLAASIRYLAEADALMDALYEAEAADILKLLPNRKAELDADRLAASPFRRRLLSAAIAHVSGDATPPRAASLERVFGQRHFTLHGVRGQARRGLWQLAPEKG